MASQFLRFTHRPFLLAIPICASYTLLRSPSPATIRCDYGVNNLLHPTHSSNWSYNSTSHGEPTTSSGLLNASTVRQISLGSVLGLVAGVGLRIFSRILTLSLGFGILLIEWAASRGYVIPTAWLQRRFKSVNFRRLTTENIPFKATFGSTMVLAAFSEF